MSAASVASYAIQLMGSLPAMVQAGVNIVSHVSEGIDALRTMQAQNRGPTQAEYDALRASNKRLHDEFQRLGGGGSGGG